MSNFSAFSKTQDCPPSAGWTRPTDWLAMPTVSPTEHKVVILKAVMNKESDFACVILNVAFGNWRVDWGDGNVTTNKTSGQQATHIYDFNNPTLDGTLTSKGYKQAIITITSDGGDITGVTLSTRYPGITGLQIYETGYLDILISMPSTTGNVNFGGTGSVVMGMVERMRVIASNVTSFANWFSYMYSLQSASAVSSSTVTNFSNMFFQCQSLTEVPDVDLSAATTVSGMFRDSGIMTFPSKSMPNCTTCESMFYGCYSLREIGDLTVSSAGCVMSSFLRDCYNLVRAPNVTGKMTGSAGTMFITARSLTFIPAYDMSGVTTTTSWLNNCTSLASSLITGLAVTHSYASCGLGPVALDTIYTNLPTVSGRTITVTNNWGTATDDPTIATAKGWTVTG